jgi:hypothetical protein
MNAHERKCSICEEVINTASKATVCMACFNKKLFSNAVQQQQELLESLYSSVEEAGVNAYKKRQWSFVHDVCGTKQTWTFANVKDRLKADPLHTPCSICGKKRK